MNRLDEVRNQLAVQAVNTALEGTHSSASMKLSAGGENFFVA